jgi:hypothetical protein
MYGLPKTITNSQGQTELVGSYIYWNGKKIKITSLHIDI